MDWTTSILHISNEQLWISSDWIRQRPPIKSFSTGGLLEKRNYIRMELDGKELANYNDLFSPSDYTCYLDNINILHHGYQESELDEKPTIRGFRERCHSNTNLTSDSIELPTKSPIIPRIEKTYKTKADVGKIIRGINNSDNR